MKNGGKNKSVAFIILFSVVYSYAVTFCLCALYVCSQKTVCQKFKVIWFKTHDFSAINMIIYSI